jgi:hypothetical protein
MSDDPKGEPTEAGLGDVNGEGEVLPRGVEEGAAASDPEPRTSSGWGRSDVAAAISCALLGLILAIMPHLVMLVRYGTADYLGDGDDVLYLAVSRQPYDGEPTLRDPFLRPGRSMPTLYVWAQFGPPAELARAIGTGHVRTALVWRAIGGPLFGLALYVLFRRLLTGVRHPVAWALGCTIVCLSDPGLIEGRMLVGAYALVKSMVLGTTTMRAPKRSASIGW